MDRFTETELLTTVDVSKLFKVSRQAVAAWIGSGKLPAFRTPGGRYRVRRSDILRFFQTNNHPVPSRLREELTHILVVDDECQVLDILRRLISARYPSVMLDTATDGVLALEKIASLIPDLLILDIRMPRMDGIEVMRRLKNIPAYSGIKILPMSADPAALNGGDRTMNAALFRKDYSFQKLVESLPALLPQMAGRLHP